MRFFMKTIDKIILAFILMIIINMGVARFFQYKTLVSTTAHNNKMERLQEKYNNESIEVSVEFNKTIKNRFGQ